jgi:hypothetical protein
VPTSFNDIYFVMDPANPPPIGTSLTAVTFLTTDQNDNGEIGRRGNDRVDGSDIRQSYPGDTVTIQTASGATITYTGVTFYLADGREVFSPIDGQTLQNGTLVATTWTPVDAPVTPQQMEVIPCFTPGTLIETSAGPRRVETLHVGERVLTQDNGLQPIRWIGRRTVIAQGDLAPIRIAAGALGNLNDMLVSPQHRMLVSGWQAELVFGEDEVLIAAKHLVDGHSIHVHPRRTVDYIHLMFDRHEIIFAEGIATESFHPGEYMLGQNDALRAEILAIFPEFREAAAPAWPTARKVAKPFEARLIAQAA